MQQIIRNLEKEIVKLLNKNDKNSEFDIFIKEIEDLKHKISKCDSERKDLIKSLDTQTKTWKRQLKRIYDLENEIEDKEDSEEVNLGLRRNKTFVHSINPDRTFNMSEVNRIEDKDEQIIALQNKIITFNQQHINEMKDFESEKNREFEKIITEKDENIQSFNVKNMELVKEIEYVKEANVQLKEKLEHSERILMEMETEIFENPLQITKEIKGKGKKLKKSGVKDHSDSILSHLDQNITCNSK